MIQIAITPEQFAAKRAQLKNEHGVDLGLSNAGQIIHNGFAAAFLYDGTTLIITIAKHPFFLTESACESHIIAWFAGS